MDNQRTKSKERKSKEIRYRQWKEEVAGWVTTRFLVVMVVMMRPK